MLVDAGCYGPVMFDFVEEPLGEIAALVEAQAELGTLEAMAEWPDVGSRRCGVMRM